MAYLHIIHPIFPVRTIVTFSQPSLEELQKLVGGYIAVVKVFYNNKKCQMIINEEGKLLDMLPNELATKIYHERRDTEDYIAGTAIILENIEID